MRVLQRDALCALAIHAQTMNRSPIIASSLKGDMNAQHGDKAVTENNTHTGGRLSMPAFDAIAPVTNGKMAAPAAPQLPTQPTAPEIVSGGRMPPAWFMRIGNMGPMSKPTKETSIALVMKCGTAQMMASSLNDQATWEVENWKQK